MKITRERLVRWLEEYRRVYKLVEMTRALIRTSRTPKEKRDPKWLAERDELQQKLERLCEEPVDESYTEVGVILRMLLDGDDSTLEVVGENSHANDQG